MIVASLLGRGLHNNIIFDSENAANRDNCFAPYVLLKNKMYLNSILLNTADINIINKVDMELHQDVQDVSDSSMSYLLMLESSFVLPSNDNQEMLTKYRKVFTWRDDLVDGNRFIKINLPNPIVIPSVDGWANRDHFCCVIAGNKVLTVNDRRDLYKERVKAIRWFEKNAANDFDLYGVDWDMPTFGAGLVGKVMRRVYRIIKPVVSYKPYPSYKGKVEHKRDVLLKTRFSICYENVRDLPGYITEKIFDCFFSGCVPVYWGASNITDYIPADCFIDRRQFKDTEAVYHFLKEISEDEFKGYQQRIAAFLASDAAKPFGSEAFAETIVSTIVKDLKGEK